MHPPDEIPSPLSVLLELASNTTLDLDPLLVSILRHAQRAAHGEGAALWLLDEAHTQAICTHGVGPETEGQVGRSIPASDLWTAETSLRRVPNLMLAPLLAHGERLGALAVSSRPGRSPVSEADAALVAALAGHAALAIKSARLYEDQRRNLERQRLSEQISRHLQQTLDPEVLIPLVLEAVSKAIGAEAQSLWLLDRETQLMVCRYATGPEADAIKKVTVPLGTGIVGSSVQKQEAILVPDAEKEELVFRGADRETGFVTRSLVCVPLVRQGKAIGAIEAVNKRGGGVFTGEDLDLLRNIADSAALSIENAQLYADLSASYDSTLDALMGALDSRDRETEGHSRRVQEYTARLARQLGLDGSVVATIRRGALIHDIGKISIPDAILKKPGPLDPEERRIMQMHALTGYEMLFGIPHLKDELAIVLAHHERWDGAGYPFGLAGEKIPLAARLFSVADTFDAVTSERPYRRARSCEAALGVIAAEEGRQFDPLVVAAFLAVPPGEWDAMRSGVVASLARRRATRDEQIRRSFTGVFAPGQGPVPPRDGP